jgi:uncharacterized protein YndB with AHSA1/START domain
LALAKKFPLLRYRFVRHEGFGRKEAIGGVYHKVEPNRRLCYSYHFQDTEFFSVISVDFAEVDDGEAI